MHRAVVLGQPRLVARQPKRLQPVSMPTGPANSRANTSRAHAGRSSRHTCHVHDGASTIPFRLATALIAAILASTPVVAIGPAHAGNPVLDMISPKQGGNEEKLEEATEEGPSLPKPDSAPAPAAGVTPIYTEDTDQVTLDQLLSEAMSFIKGEWSCCVL
jgi:hypothetical protein